jgi:hypothetical protein
MANDNKKPEKSADARKAALRAGGIVLFLLAVLTLGEFLVAVIAPPWIFVLWIVAFWKTFYVVKDYMHIGRLFSEEDSH